MNENGQFSKVSCVRFERLLPGPIERVFEFLTKPEFLPGWFGNGVIEHRLGGKVSLMDGHIRGTVTQWLPPHRLSYSWNVFSPGEELSAHPQSYLTLELQPRGDEVLLTLTHLPILERHARGRSAKRKGGGAQRLYGTQRRALRGRPRKARAVSREPLETFTRSQ